MDIYMFTNKKKIIIFIILLLISINAPILTYASEFMFYNRKRQKLST